MKTRPFKDNEISLLGLGTMRLPMSDKNPENIDTEKAEKLLDYALKNGVNYIDTAYMYHDGKSETFLGEALKKYNRKRFYLATKMPVWLGKTAEGIEKIFEEQLQKLDTDFIDFYLCHNLNNQFFPMAEKLKTYEFLAKKKEEGIIKHLGFSFHDTPEVLKQILKAHPWDFAQIQLNYIDWEFQKAKEQYEILTKQQIPTIVMEPVRGGALANLPQQCNNILKEARPNASAASWAMTFAAELPNVLTVLSGMSTIEQLKENIDTINELAPLSPKEHRILEKAKDSYLANKTIPCTGCRYCMDCRQGVDIPSIFQIANNYLLGASAYNLTNAYENLKPSQRESNCTQCGNCTEKCPQNINIPLELERVGALVQKAYHQK